MNPSEREIEARIMVDAINCGTYRVILKNLQCGEATISILNQQEASLIAQRINNPNEEAIRIAEEMKETRNIYCPTAIDINAYVREALTELISRLREKGGSNGR